MFLVPDSPMEGSFEAASPAPSYLPPRNRPTATASSLDEIGAVMATCFGLAARETSSGWVADRELAREQSHELRGNGKDETLALAEAGRLVLKHPGRDRPVAGPAQVHLADGAAEEDPLDRGGKAVPVGRDRGAQREGLGTDRDRHGRSLRQSGTAAGRLGDQTAQRRAHHHLATGLAAVAVDLTLKQVGRAEQTRDEDIDRMIVQLLRRADLENPPQVHHRQPIRV